MSGQCIQCSAPLDDGDPTQTQCPACTRQLALLTPLPAVESRESKVESKTWLAVQSANGTCYVTYRRFERAADAITAAAMCAHNWPTLGPWRVVRLTEEVVWTR